MTAGVVVVVLVVVQVAVLAVEAIAEAERLPSAPIPKRMR